MGNENKVSPIFLREECSPHNALDLWRPSDEEEAKPVEGAHSLLTDTGKEIANMC